MALTFGERPWYEQQNFRNPQFLQSTILQIAQLRERKKQRRNRRMEKELSVFMDMAQKYPEVVDTMGPDLVERYGEDAPFLEPFLGAIKNRQRRVDEIRQAGRSWLDKADQGFEENLQRQQQGMMNMAMGAMGVRSPEEGWQGMRQYQQSAQQAPGQILQDAARQMSPSERSAAALWAKSRGMPFPEPHYPRPFDPMKDIPVGQRPIWMMQQGQLDPSTPMGQAALQHNEFLMSPVDRERFELQKEQEARSQESLGLRREKFERQKTKPSAREKPRSDLSTFKNIAKGAAEESQTKLESLPRDELSFGDEQALEERGITVKDPKKKFKPLKGHLESIASAAHDAYMKGELSKEDAQRAAEEAARRYTDLVLSGMLPGKAMKEIRGSQ